jgi:hypothetical protein
MQDPQEGIDGQRLVEDTRKLANNAQDYYMQLRRDNPLGRAYRENPYAVVAAAIGVGYVIGGGLFTPFTRRVLRMGMRALVIPMVATQIKSLTQPPDSP